ncbi:MAG: quinone-interacting membrane-bound oxidoreductase complex subunit QmoC [Desulfatitalea sp.]|nr:quinone-interacting membrane-bound oxidoreductase complex subunit QmoC [Desulfatitalea sp.]NNK01034.1 quinone-interacting membrane-bound oxidoreductase complex subunit QmoC [Desulfatitalea sp.]
MSDSYIVDPDVGFIEEVTRLGGQDLKKCYQCATCSVACPISPDTKPFPRKEMLATSWGLKNRLIGNGDIWLCHNCGDCTTRCPRGAKPGDVLAAVRAYTVTEYAVPKALGKMVNNPSSLPVLMAIPIAIFLVVGLVLKMFGVNWLNFNPAGDQLWQADYISNYLVDIIMVPTFCGAIGVFALGLKRFITDIHANALLEGKTDKEKIEPVEFIRSLIKVLPTIMRHNRFSECGENKDRATAHMMVLFGFIGLFIVTGTFFFAEWVLHIEGPYSQWSPVKWLANAGGIALIIGGSLMIAKRMGQQDQITSYKDWYLIGLVLVLGGTGLLTEMLRLGHLYDLSAFIYVLHLIAVWMLFAYTPFSKLAHFVYRTVAMAYQSYSGRT